MFKFKKNLVYLLCIGLSLILFSSFVHADDDDDENGNGVSAEFGVFFSNKFIEEGISEVPGQAVMTPELEIEFEGLHIGDFEVPSFFIEGELAMVESENLRESELSIGKEWEFDNFSMTLGYTWVYEDEEEEEEGDMRDPDDDDDDDEMRDPDDDDDDDEEEEEPNDHEFFLGLSCECLPFEIVPDLTYVYSTEADGGMIEIELAREIEMEHFSIEPYVGAIIDFGYVSDEYDGLNNIFVGLAVNVPLNDAISLGMYATHSFAEENLRRDGHDDQTWAGIGLEIEM